MLTFQTERKKRKKYGKNAAIAKYQIGKEEKKEREKKKQ